MNNGSDKQSHQPKSQSYSKQLNRLLENQQYNKASELLCTTVCQSFYGVSWKAQTMLFSGDIKDIIVRNGPPFGSGNQVVYISKQRILEEIKNRIAEKDKQQFKQV
jgi:hypothetical protein